MVSFELDGPWRAMQLLDGFFDVQQDVGSPDVIALQFARPDRLYDAAGAVVSATTARAAAEAVADNVALDVLGESPSRIGGLHGFTVEVGNAGDRYVAVLKAPTSALGIGPGRRMWISFFDTPDGLLAIMVGGSSEKWSEALAIAEPVLESVRIGP
ncbi:MAG: hypothetical protein ABJC24_02830 [Chloroflexota bacterium]